MNRARTLFIAGILAATGVTLAGAQIADPLGQHTTWLTQHTRHFSVHYPAELGAWATAVATRLDSIHGAVGTQVGNLPPRRTTVVIADPYNVSNGFALPMMDLPTMVLWPTPPQPRMSIGDHRGWGETLAVHEYAHLAHLAWPSRNRRDRLIWNLLPGRLGPVVRRSPRWVIEGYATLLEGRLTGQGRPHGVWRPAILRRWALEGRLPTYGQLSSWGAYQGGAMAYLAGSAYLEWLVERHGEESLNHVWRRMTAVQRRSFSAAFAGVYGAPPEELYGRFTVELMREALEAERLIDEAGGPEVGEQFQRLSWHTGDPAVSPDGRRLAIVLRARNQPSRVVIWNTEEPEDTLAEERRQRLLERDPLDVPGIEWRPPPKRALATLLPAAGRGHDDPRFLPDGRHVLVTRSEPLPDGRMRPDLFRWDTRTGSLRRITRGAAVRQPDPSPDGARAAATRCDGGICSVVSIDLATGAVGVLLRGTPDTVFYRPRYSPDGSQIAVAVQIDGRWRTALTGPTGGTFTFAGPDDGHDRYDPVWEPGGATLLVTSHRGGVPNLERLVLETGEAQPLTRAIGAAVAPEPNPADGSIFFLHLTTRGLDLHRLPPGAQPLADVLDLRPLLRHVAPTAPPVEPDTFPRDPLPAPVPYGLGPRAQRVLPAGAFTADGESIALGIYGSDPIGRLGWGVTGATGDPRTWRGAGVQTAFRGFRPDFHLAAWWGRQHATHEVRNDELDVAPLDVTYTGAAFWTDYLHHTTSGTHRARLGVSAGSVDPLHEDSDLADHAGRHFAFAELATAFRIGGRTRLLPAATLRGSAGSTDGEPWQRAEGILRIAITSGGGSISVQGSHGMLRGEAGRFEWFTAGGSTSHFFEPRLLPQRHAVPGIPLGTVQGERLSTVRVSLGTGLLSPFGWGARTPGMEGWYRIVGLERAIEDGPAPLVRMPRARILGGIAYPLDEPFRHRLRAYLSVEFRP